MHIVPQKAARMAAGYCLYNFRGAGRQNWSYSTKRQHELYRGENSSVGLLSVMVFTCANAIGEAENSIRYNLNLTANICE